MASTKRKQATKTPTTKAPGRRGALSEQLVFRVTKASRARLRKWMHERELTREGDGLRAVLREVGI